MITLAAVPAAITVTNNLATPLIVANLRFEPAVARILPLNAMGDGYRSCIWQALHIARTKGHISTNPATDDLADPVDSGHTLFGGHVAR